MILIPNGYLYHLTNDEGIGFSIVVDYQGHIKGLRSVPYGMLGSWVAEI